MAKAMRSLSPKRAAERMQRFNSAVRTIALYRAKKAVQAQIRARGERIADYSCREMSMMAEAHFARHRDELINKAAADVATFPEFSRYRVECAELSTDAQTQNTLNSMGSTVQMSGAK
jgi:hypothetical protein